MKCIIKGIYQKGISGEKEELSADYIFNLRDRKKHIKKGKVKFQFINLSGRNDGFKDVSFKGKKANDYWNNWALKLKEWKA